MEGADDFGAVGKAPSGVGIGACRDSTSHAHHEIIASSLVGRRGPAPTLPRSRGAHDDLWRSSDVVHGGMRDLITMTARAPRSSGTIIVVLRVSGSRNSGHRRPSAASLLVAEVITPARQYPIRRFTARALRARMMTRALAGRFRDLFHLPQSHGHSTRSPQRRRALRVEPPPCEMCKRAQASRLHGSTV
jgi:hypothetical protein